MAFTALSILTHGWHHPGEVAVEVSDAPNVMAVVEVRPTMRGTVPPPTGGPAGVPVTLSGVELKPELRKAEGPEQSTGSDDPTILSAKDLVPVIRKAEEE